jgi:hypothetical protein
MIPELITVSLIAIAVTALHVWLAIPMPYDVQPPKWRRDTGSDAGTRRRTNTNGVIAFKRDELKLIGTVECMEMPDG